MSYSGRLAVCFAASVAAHLLLARGSGHLPPRVEAAPVVTVRVELHEQPLPEPEPEPAAPETPPPTKAPVHEAPIRHARRVTTETPVPTNAPKQTTPTERPATTDTGATPVFGVSMESTSAAGTGPAMPIGNTLQARPQAHPGEGEGTRPLLAPVPAYEVTKMALPKAQCTGKYTDEAREAGLEGVVILDLVVDERGKVRKATVVQGLGMGLTEAAKRAAQACEFSPGEHDGKPVVSRVPAFKFRFVLSESE